MPHARVSLASAISWPSLKLKSLTGIPTGWNAAFVRPSFRCGSELAQFDWSCVQGVNKTRVLELAQGGYITQAQPILMIGNPGLGKTHVAIGLALSACRQGKYVRFYNVATLVNDLICAQQDLKLSRFMAAMCKVSTICWSWMNLASFL